MCGVEKIEVVTSKGGFGRAMRSLFRKVSDIISSGAIIKSTVRVGKAVVLPLMSISFNVKTNSFGTRGGSETNNKVNKGVAPDTIVIVRSKGAGLIGVGGRSAVAGLLSVMPSIMSHFASGSRGLARRSMTSVLSTRWGDC